MAQIFRIATKEAIREIILSEAQANRFGILMTDSQLETITERVVDLMETAINLRSGVQSRLENTLSALSQAQHAAHQATADERAGFRPGQGSGRLPRARAASEIYSPPDPQQSMDDTIPLYSGGSPALPRRRVAISETERARLAESRR